MERSLSLSREEQEELARSNKKVKNVSHAGYQEGLESTPSTPSQGYSPWNQAASFKDKLVGEIPGAFTQAFSFEDLMDDDLESDDEVEGLREGLLAVRFSKDLKQRMRTPWAKALIVKVYGRSVGFNFLHNRLLSLWKPAGRLDCVGLGNGFFLTRFYLKEDFETVLKRGPWFVGEHFLSIRPWMPNFRPTTANVSSIAVWIRLNELPIEYYNAEALLQIGKTIGNVLRVDTHTASETRGRFARLCVQVDVNKPLATAILIGKFEQPICYEGIHKLCFVCGRMGHKQEYCPQVIRQDLPLKKAETVAEEERDVDPCNERVADMDKFVQGPTESMLANEQREGTDVRYGPWVVVTRKKIGTKNQRSGGTSMVQSSGQLQQPQRRSEPVSKTSFAPRQLESRSDTVKEAKRKLNGPAVDSVIQRIVNEPNRRAQGSFESSKNFKELVHSKSQFGVDLSKPNPSHKASVKGKKVLARLKASQTKSESAVACPLLQQRREVECSVTASASCSNHGGQRRECSNQFQFTTGQQPEVGQPLRGRGSGDSGDGKTDRCNEMDQRRAQESMEVECAAEGGESKDGRGRFFGPSVVYGGEPMEALEEQTHCAGSSRTLIDGYAQSTSGFTGDGGGTSSAQDDLVTGRGTDVRYAEAERMEFEGEGEATAIG
nr:uncharacterized protein CFP56_62396 [Quercus suber]